MGPSGNPGSSPRLRVSWLATFSPPAFPFATYYNTFAGSRDEDVFGDRYSACRRRQDIRVSSLQPSSPQGGSGELGPLRPHPPPSWEGRACRPEPLPSKAPHLRGITKFPVPVSSDRSPVASGPHKVQGQDPFSPWAQPLSLALHGLPSLLQSSATTGPFVQG